jgi:hypothetical protein
MCRGEPKENWKDAAHLRALHVPHARASPRDYVARAALRFAGFENFIPAYTARVN